MARRSSRPIARRLFDTDISTRNNTNNNQDNTVMPPPAFGPASSRPSGRPLPSLAEQHQALNDLIDEDNRAASQGLTSTEMFQQVTADRAAASHRESKANPASNPSTTNPYSIPNTAVPSSNITQAQMPLPVPADRPAQTPSNAPANYRSIFDYYRDQQYLAAERAENRYQAGRVPDRNAFQPSFPNMGIAQERSRQGNVVDNALMGSRRMVDGSLMPEAMLDDPDFQEFAASAHFLPGREGPVPDARDTRAVLQYAARPLVGAPAPVAEPRRRPRLASVSTLAMSPAQQLRRPTVSDMSGEGDEQRPAREQEGRE